MPPKPTPARSNGQSGESNPNWRGGRSLASHGYVLVRVGVGHPLADVRGYAYEHRLVAESKLGRPLRPGEQIHHVNGDKADNRPENLEVCADLAEHRARHRGPDCARRLPGQANPEVLCVCGCDQGFPRYDDSGRPRIYIAGHNPRPSRTQDGILAAMGDCTEMRLGEPA